MCTVVYRRACAGTTNMVFCLVVVAAASSLSRFGSFCDDENVKNTTGGAISKKNERRGFAFLCQARGDG